MSDPSAPYTPTLNPPVPAGLMIIGILSMIPGVSPVLVNDSVQWVIDNPVVSIGGSIIGGISILSLGIGIYAATKK